MNHIPPSSQQQAEIDALRSTRNETRRTVVPALEFNLLSVQP